MFCFFFDFLRFDFQALKMFKKKFAKKVITGAKFTIRDPKTELVFA